MVEEKYHSFNLKEEHIVCTCMKIQEVHKRTATVLRAVVNIMGTCGVLQEEKHC
nr:MAG TPA: hypothetical protein [Caudoviricetes sp.]